ncbi:MULTISPECIES: muramoyltetrapeptide carboxypeptidase [Tenebrionibacter/Tenebrionicola group]|jgi:muramoyltetrapeptide carboxypeptidase|uniref:Muramoyltetrapeptide carboxypeptidase n=2 Tax=Tenebrionibacter/Tenebrionicola group TaxID=2969848 RepID=A0A8K0UZQ8_9ENTR|nr:MULTISPECIES: muramoyltetrapeptide carboxypeptidase [Tenebrionibacter/Tenebrionicola group]MBK4713858.1 muramoyltetrapeptide carboxypeptidase [Tenebrionibacter intestinalis]MBV4411531.1 muramoyltetrapeptide carboxypeptidase [Tenebrionicola larvae]MBV5094739.1 muramoyltetrapeptide carboxypeptidase [Tenebrionicola larvae]
MATFHLIAPSGYCLQQQAAERGVAHLRAGGHRVENTQVIPRRWQRFAGSDAERLADLNQLAELPEEQAIVLAVRGGYGVSRLLENIDYAAIGERQRRCPLLICGHSDFTAFQLALLAREGVITFSGPMLAGNFGAGTLSEFTIDHFWQALRQPRFTLRWASSAPQPFSARGMVWGGNLAMLTALLATPWMPQTDNGILVVEDINEHPYRVERMLLQLYHAGVLARQSALVLGSFSAAKPNDYDNGYELAQVIAAVRRRIAIPVIAGLAFGHEPATVTLPLGAQGELIYDGAYAHLTLSGHPTLV